METNSTTSCTQDIEFINIDYSLYGNSKAKRKIVKYELKEEADD